MPSISFLGIHYCIILVCMVKDEQISFPISKGRSNWAGFLSPSRISTAIGVIFSPVQPLCTLFFLDSNAEPHLLLF